MRIKRIEITGFKSFCDRSVVTLDDSITAIVGPNGCGKSNIVDAIRWCMGEQSAKHLRGKAMEDVIFAGSETRGPAPMAEVSLTFDEVGFSHEVLARAQLSEAETRETLAAAGAEDSEITSDEAITDAAADLAALGTANTEALAVFDENGAPIQSTSEEVREFLTDATAPSFSAYSEVTITRRLFRDGASHYFLNKTPCRLRDITDFFLGTGVGTKAYAIIEQGRVGQIVSARPGDRRQIIEEAAGVTKFKSKKKAAERKLEQTKQNLLRVTDIVVELEKRLGTLKRQAQKAERFRAYRAELSDLELWKASHRFLELQAQLSFTNSALSSASASLGDLRTEFETADATLAAARAELALEERSLSALQERVFELENECHLLSSRADMDESRAKELSARLERARLELADVNAQHETHTRELADREEVEQSVRTALLDAEAALASDEERLVDCRQRATTTSKELEAARSQAAALRAQETQRLVKAEGLARNIANANERLTQLSEESEHLSGELRNGEREAKRVGDSLQDARQMRFDLGSQLQAFQERAAELTASVRDNEQTTEELRTELHLRKSRLISLQEITAKFEGFARGTRSLMTDDRVAGICGLIADSLRVPAAYEAAVESALGERLGGLLVATVEEGRSAIDHLRQTAAGKASLVAMQQAATRDNTDAALPDGALGWLADMVELTSETAHLRQTLLGGILVAENLETAIALGQDAGFPVVTLQGDLFDRGTLLGGSRDEAGASVLGQRREIRELTDLVTTLEGELNAAATALVVARGELAQCQKALDGMKAESHQGDLAIMAHEKDLARASAEVDRFRHRLDAIAKERMHTETRREELATEAASLAAEELTCRNALAEIEARQLGIAQEATHWMEQVEVANQAQMANRVLVAQLREQNSTVAVALRNLRQGRDALAHRSQQLATEASDAESRIHELLATEASLRVELAAKSDEHHTRAMELSQRRADYEGRLRGQTDLDAMVRDLRQRADVLADETGQLDRRATELSVQRSSLIESIQERHGTELVLVVADYHDRHEPGIDADARIHELRDLVAKMGTDINLTAIEECADVSQRHEFLATQKLDLERAVAQLEEAIAKINTTSRQLFAETFESVNATFQRVFPRLFRGGQAKLSLVPTEDGDILEAGVEIMAQPPGKKNSTVDQLSGGEKALTAVAMIFSIFLIKPSPFCILDEVDAPLDEANVDRYNEIVREMTDRSQFIVISHNKRTMESADHLYGVTMQEPGVSKLVAVHLSRLGAGTPSKPDAAATVLA